MSTVKCQHRRKQRLNKASNCVRIMHELALIIVFIGQLWTVHLIRTGRVNYLWEKESRKRKKSNVGDEAVTAE